MYIVAFALLIYSHVKNIKSKKPKDPSILMRRFYFTYVLFLLIFVLPELNKYNILDKDNSILGLSKTVSTSMILIGVSLVVYIVIISDVHISEVTIGKAKISMLKEKYEEEIVNHIDITNILLGKISAENKVIQNLKKYCISVQERLYQTQEIYVSQEYQMLLEEYFGCQKENIKVSVVDEIDANEIRKDYELRGGEFSELQYRMEHEEVYSVKKSNSYYLFIPYCYRFEGFNEKVYVILESETPIIIEAETKIIPNILVEFTDELLSLVDIDIKEEECYNLSRE